MIVPDGRRGEDTTFGWLPGLVLSVMIAIACLALIVGIVLYLKGPKYAGQENEFKNFVGFLRTFDESELENMPVYLFLARNSLIVGFDGGDRTLLVAQLKQGNQHEAVPLRSPCGTGKCLCLYHLGLSDTRPSPQLSEISCKDVKHVPYVPTSLEVVASSKEGSRATVTVQPFSFTDQRHAEYAVTYGLFLAGAQQDPPSEHPALIPWQRIMLEKQPDGVITANTEGRQQHPLTARCERIPATEGQRVRTQEETSRDQTRCAGQFISKIYADGRCLRTLSDGTPYPVWADESVPEAEKRIVYCIFKPKARDYSFSTKVSDGTAAQAPNVKMLNSKHADLTFQFHRTDMVPADAVCSVTLRFREGATEKSYPFVSKVACGSCAHTGAPENYCYLMPLEATIDGEEDRRPASVLSILEKLDPQQQDVLLNSVMQAWINNQQFGFDVDFEAHSPADSSWSYAETQRIEYRPAQP